MSDQQQRPPQQGPGWAAERIRISVDAGMRDALQDYARRHGLSTGQAAYRILELWRAGR